MILQQFTFYILLHISFLFYSYSTSFFYACLIPLFSYDSNFYLCYFYIHILCQLLYRILFSTIPVHLFFICHTVFFGNTQLYIALLSMAPFFETDIFYMPVLYLCLMFIRILCFFKFYFDPAVSGRVYTPRVFRQARNFQRFTAILLLLK